MPQLAQSNHGFFFLGWPIATEIKRSLPNSWTKVKKAGEGGYLPSGRSWSTSAKTTLIWLPEFLAMKQDEQVSSPESSSWVSAKSLVVCDVNAHWLNSGFPWWSHKSCQISFKAARNSYLHASVKHLLTTFVKAKNNLCIESLLTVLFSSGNFGHKWSKTLFSEGSLGNRAYLMWQMCPGSSRQCCGWEQRDNLLDSSSKMPRLSQVFRRLVRRVPRCCVKSLPEGASEVRQGIGVEKCSLQPEAQQVRWDMYSMALEGGF